MWSAPTGYAVPLVVGDNVISMRNQFGVGLDMTSVTSFRLADGAVNWTYTNRFVFPSQPTYSDGLVVYTATDSPGGPTRLNVHNASTGALLYTVSGVGSLNDAMPTVAAQSGHREFGGLRGGRQFAHGRQPRRYVRVGLVDAIGQIWRVVDSDRGRQLRRARRTRAILCLRPDNGGDEPLPHRRRRRRGGTTVAYDQARREFYVRETYSSGVNKALTAYSYIDQNNIVQLWQRTGPGIGSGASVAIGPDGKIYSVDNTTLVELDPATGAVLRSLMGQSFANAVTPILSDGYVWVYSESQTLVYGLNTLTLCARCQGRAAV